MFNHKSIVTSRARQVVQDFLDHVTKDDAGLDDVTACPKELLKLGDATLPAFIEAAVSHDDSCSRLVASWAILVAADSGEEDVPEQSVLMAQQQLADGLRSVDYREQAWACTLLSNGPVPDNSIQFLRQILDTDDGILRIVAAAALAASASFDSTVLAILGRALRGESKYCAAIAGVAFARLLVRQAEAAEVINTALPDLEAMVQYQIIQKLKWIGPAAAITFPTLSTLVLNEEAHPAVRGIAASAIGRMVAGTNKAVAVLTQALYSGHWKVVDGAAEGLALCLDVPDAAITQLSVLLSDNVEDLRGVAADALKRLKHRAASAIPTLIGRIGVEPSHEVREAIGGALSEMGDDVVPRLVELLHDNDARIYQVAVFALSEMGASCSPRIAEALRTTQDIGVRQLLLGVLVRLGRRATPALPTLGAMLDEVSDDESSRYAVMGIYACGDAARAVIPSLVRCIERRDDEVSLWAMRSLRELGEDAIAALRDAIKRARGVGAARLSRALDQIVLSDPKHMDELADVDTNLLNMFAHVASILDQHGPLSWPRIEALLLERQRSIGIDFTFGASASNLRLGIAQLSRILKVPLTSHLPHRKGGLTDEGRIWMRKVRLFLEIPLE